MTIIDDDLIVCPPPDQMMIGQPCVRIFRESKQARPESWITTESIKMLDDKDNIIFYTAFIQRRVVAQNGAELLIFYTHDEAVEEFDLPASLPQDRDRDGCFGPMTYDQFAMLDNHLKSRCAECAAKIVRQNTRGGRPWLRLISKDR